MATSREWETIEQIEKCIDIAKKEKRDTVVVLSRGKEYYRKALLSIYNCGIFTIFSSICCLIAGLVFNIYQAAQGALPNDIAYIIGIFLGIGLVCIIPMELGFKMIKFNTTPRFMLGMIIVSLIFHIILFAGIIPLVAIIFDIIALARWSTYKDWFYTIKVRK